MFHRWERRLAGLGGEKLPGTFDWGLDWLGLNAAENADDVPRQLEAWAAKALASSDEFFGLPPCAEYELTGDRLSFPSAVITPHASNNTVHARFFPESSPRGRRRAVLVLPQWNADNDGHVALCRLLNRMGITALRLSLPYHHDRKLPELSRADYIVSANIGRTLQVCRQAVLDGRRAIAWLTSRGYESIGVVGTSLGSCLSMLIAAHEPLVKAAALNHISPYFADVIWDGISTAHLRPSLEGQIDLECLRRIWMPISPFPYLDRVRGKKVLLVYAEYDLTFPVGLSRVLVDEFRRRGVEHELAVLPCGHYSTAVTPFKWVAGFTLCRFLTRSL
ncbi:MAG: hypothetical protein LC804_03790 [Acidobacteria bacterium]|nr:hypothetical protein [Acidobacteriota bacterium]